MIERIRLWWARHCARRDSFVSCGMYEASHWANSGMDYVACDRLGCPVASTGGCLADKEAEEKYRWLCAERGIVP